MDRRPDPGRSAVGPLYSPFGSLGSMDGESVDICIVGAGLSGLHLAHRLEGSGLDCLLLDKGRSPGGRAATRRIGEARVDHGLPWLTAGGDLSSQLIEGFRRDGLLEPVDAGGSAGFSASFRRNMFMPFTIRNIAQATIRKLMMKLMNLP